MYLIVALFLLAACFSIIYDLAWGHKYIHLTTYTWTVIIGNTFLLLFYPIPRLTLFTYCLTVIIALTITWYSLLNVDEIHDEINEHKNQNIWTKVQNGLGFFWYHYTAPVLYFFIVYIFETFKLTFEFSLLQHFCLAISFCLIYTLIHDISKIYPTNNFFIYLFIAVLSFVYSGCLITIIHEFGRNRTNISA